MYILSYVQFILDTRFELKLEANLLYYGYCNAFHNLSVHSFGPIEYTVFMLCMPWFVLKKNRMVVYHKY